MTHSGKLILQRLGQAEKQNPKKIRENPVRSKAGVDEVAVSGSIGLIENPDVLTRKGEIRAVFRKRRMQLSGARSSVLSGLVAENLFSLERYRAARTVALYFPIAGEVSTLEIFENSVRFGKAVYFPRVEGSELEFGRVCEMSELAVESYGIPEPPRSSPSISINDIDLAIIPCVAFDRSGGRLGYGHGYYDRSIGGVERRRRVALAYGFQVVDALPNEKSDVEMGLVVTDEGTIFCEGGRT
ncbi:MAG: 5-formyltetrahydrofolate cyclo-ligase [Thermodesulfobacteriota bacterium]